MRRAGRRQAALQTEPDRRARSMRVAAGAPVRARRRSGQPLRAWRARSRCVSTMTSHRAAYAGRAAQSERMKCYGANMDNRPEKRDWSRVQTGRAVRRRLRLPNCESARLHRTRPVRRGAPIQPPLLYRYARDETGRARAARLPDNARPPVRRRHLQPHAARNRWRRQRCSGSSPAINHWYSHRRAACLSISWRQPPGHDGALSFPARRAAPSLKIRCLRRFQRRRKKPPLVQRSEECRRRFLWVGVVYAGKEARLKSCFKSGIQTDKVLSIILQLSNRFLNIRLRRMQAVFVKPPVKRGPPAAAQFL